MHISRRNVLRTAAVLPLAAALAGCATSSGTFATITQAALNAAAAIEGGFAAIKGLVPAATQDAIKTAIDAAESVLGGLVPGAIVPLTSVQNVFTDLETAQAAAAKILVGNPIVEAIGLALPIIAALAQVAMPTALTLNGETPDQAVSDLLSKTTYTGRILIKHPS